VDPAGTGLWVTLHSDAEVSACAGCLSWLSPVNVELFGQGVTNESLRILGSDNAIVALQLSATRITPAALGSVQLTNLTFLSFGSDLRLTPNVVARLSHVPHLRTLSTMNAADVNGPMIEALRKLHALEYLELDFMECRLKGDDEALVRVPRMIWDSLPGVLIAFE
jgi:hypothetical protein